MKAKLIFTDYNQGVDQLSHLGCTDFKQSKTKDGIQIKGYIGGKLIETVVIKK